MEVLTTIKDLALIAGVVVAAAVLLFNRKRAAGADLQVLRNELRVDVKALQEVIAANAKELRAEMKAMQETIAANAKELRADMKAMQETIAANAKDNTRELRAEMKAMQETTAASVKELRADMKAMQETIAANVKDNARELRAEMRTLQEYIDTRVNDLRRDIHALSDRLTAVEVRLDERTPPPSWLYAGIPSVRQGAGSEVQPADAPGGGIDPVASPAVAPPTAAAS